MIFICAQHAYLYYAPRVLEKRVEQFRCFQAQMMTTITAMMIDDACVSYWNDVVHSLWCARSLTGRRSMSVVLWQMCDAATVGVIAAADRAWGRIYTLRTVYPSVAKCYVEWWWWFIRECRSNSFCFLNTHNEIGAMLIRNNIFGKDDMLWFWNMNILKENRKHLH